MNDGQKAALVGLVWFLVGGAIGGVSSVMLALVAMGGQQEPPAFWAIALVIGMFGLPLMFAFGGIPVAHRVSVGRPAKKLTGKIIGISIALLVIVWTVVLVWRPQF